MVPDTITGCDIFINSLRLKEGVERERQSLSRRKQSPYRLSPIALHELRIASIVMSSFVKLVSISCHYSILSFHPHLNHTQIFLM